MLSENAARCAAELRELSEAGVLARLGRVALGAVAAVAVLPYDTAVRIALADLDHVTDRARLGGYVGAGRWRAGA